VKQRNANRFRPGLEQFEDRTVPSSVIYSATGPMSFIDASGGTRVLNVTETVTYDAPGHEGLYLWEYTIENASATTHPIEAVNGASGVVVIGYNQAVNELPDNIDTTLDWENLGYDPGLVFWDSQIGHGDLNTETPFISIGTSQTFSFTTTPQPLVNSYLTYAVTDVNDKSPDYYVYGATIKVPGPPVYWVGGTDGDGNPSNDNSWMNPNNWTSHEVPDQYTAVYFASNYSNYDAILPNSPVQVAELHMVNGYSGTVTLGSTLSVGKFELTTGAISQPNAGNDLSVTKNFLWTGGILNSTSNASTLHLVGATATIGAGNAITTGSTISLEVGNGIGAIATFLPGTLNFTNGGALDIGEFCMVDVEPEVNADVTFGGQPNPFGASQINLKAGGYLRVKTPQAMGRAVFAPNLPLKNTGGDLEIQKFVDVTFTGLVGGIGGNRSLQQDDGRLLLWNDATLTVENGIELRKGLLRTIAIGGGANQTATINGDMLNSGADIEINYSGPLPPGHVFGGELFVSGDVIWAGGKYRPYVDASQPGKADLWHVGKTLTVQFVPELAPAVVGGAVPANSTWLIIKANTKIDGIPPAMDDWTIVTDAASPPKMWYLKS
jgi:hypothetical protein